MRTPAQRLVGLVAGSVVLALAGAGPAGALPGGHATAGSTGTPQAAPVSHRDGPRQLGRWTVAPVGPDAYRLTWHSPTRIPTTDAPVQVGHDGSLVRVGVRADARTVSLVVWSPTPPDPATYDVVVGAKVLDRRGGGPARTGSERTPYRAPSTRALLGDLDPGHGGTHAITSTDYRLAPVKLPGIKQLSEMVGHVVAPVDATDAAPLVLFLHGRHEPCYTPDEASPPQGPGHLSALGGLGSRTARNAAGAQVWSCPAGQLPVPSYLGYDYVQRLLASQGYVTVSISADAINALDFDDIDGGAAARAALIRDHLRAWVGFAQDGTHPADLSNVVLVGHSRGGEGVDRASLDLPRDEGYQVTGQVLIGPTDFAFQAAPATPTVTLLPYCDGDVSDLQGQNFTDDGRDVTADPSADLAFHSSVLVMGADHNFFNSEWTPGTSVAPSFDDWGGPADGACGSKDPARLSAAEQRRVGRTYIAGAVHLFADGDDSVLPMFDGSPVSVPSAGNADVRSHAIGGGLVTVRPGIDGSPSTGATAHGRLCEGVSDSEDDTSCQKELSSVRAPHWPSQFFAGVPHRQFLEVGWRSAGLEAGLDLAQPWDLSADSRLDLRTVVDPRRGPVRLGVTLTDADGHSATLTPVGGGNLSPLPGGSYSLAKRWGQDLRASLAGAPGIDLSRVVHVGLSSENPKGRVFLVDVSATPDAGVSTDPAAPTPLFSIDTVAQPEGDGTDPVTVDVPWHVIGDLDHDAAVTIVHGTPFSFDDSVKTERLDIPAHTSGGVLHVRYRPNDLDDRGLHLIGFTAYAVDGIETDQYVGGASIIDDDPTPALTLHTGAHRITAGHSATWTLTLGKPVNYYSYALASPVKAVDGPQLRVGDLTKRFRERYLGDHVDLDTPLYKSTVQFFIEIRPHRVSGTLSIPTRRERGPTRALSLRFRGPHLQLANRIRTVKVAPSR
ncbi:MAG TPA: hypothetical protein VH228_15440 [Nocardioides sp.]|nr:hypothetical protein [Nocardioides sp.]